MKSYYVDAHSHLDGFGDELPEAVWDIAKHDVRTLAVSMDMETYEVAQAASAHSKLITPAFGIHPNRARDYANRLDELDALIASAPAVGEIGLCARWAQSDLSAQHKVFNHQLALAVRHSKPVNLHTADMEHEVLAALEGMMPPSVLIHWYSGPLGLVEQFVQLGCYFTVSVDIMTSEFAREVALRIPADRLLTETDGPQALPWVGGGYGWPHCVVDVLAALAEVRDIDALELQHIVNANYERFLAGE